MSQIPAHRHSQKTKITIFSFHFSALFILTICFLGSSDEHFFTHAIHTLNPRRWEREVVAQREMHNYWGVILFREMLINTLMHCCSTKSKLLRCDGAAMIYCKSSRVRSLPATPVVFVFFSFSVFSFTGSFSTSDTAVGRFRSQLLSELLFLPHHCWTIQLSPPFACTIERSCNGTETRLVVSDA